MAGISIWEAELARRNLLDFTSSTMANFHAGWFHKMYYKKLNDFAHGKIKKLMVFVPPQHGKSEGSTRRLPAFLIGNNPNKRIAITCYSASKARKFNREIQRIIDDEPYKAIFPNIQLSNGSDGYSRTFDEFEVVGSQGSVKTVGVGGPLTGEPVDILIMDDIYKDWSEAQSEVIRASKQDWYDSVADTRLHNGSQQLLVFTRWHEYDLAGYLLSKEPEEWEVILYQALKVGDPTPEDPRQHGEALYPEKHSVEKLEATRKRNEHNFEGLYQQNPKPKVGLLFPVEELNYFDPSEKIHHDYCFICCDPANEGGDDFAGGVFKLVGERIYLTEVIYNTEGADHNEKALVDLIIKENPAEVGVEATLGWVETAQRVEEAIIKKGFRNEFRQLRPRTAKHSRIMNRSSFIRNNFYFRSDWEQYPQYAKFMRCLTSYLKIQEAGRGNKHDDAPDLCEMAGSFFEKNFTHLWQISDGK